MKALSPNCCMTSANLGGKSCFLMSVTDAWKFVVACSSGLKSLPFFLRSGIGLTGACFPTDGDRRNRGSFDEGAAQRACSDESEITRWQVIYISRRPVRALGELPVNGDFERSLEKA